MYVWMKYLKFSSFQMYKKITKLTFIITEQIYSQTSEVVCSDRSFHPTFLVRIHRIVKWNKCFHY